MGGEGGLDLQPGSNAGVDRGAKRLDGQGCEQLKSGQGVDGQHAGVDDGLL